MKNKIYKILTGPIILIFIAMITYYRWLSFDIFASGDWWYFTKYTMAEYFPISIWYALFGFGGVDITLWRVPIINIPFGIFGNLGLGQEIAEKFAIFWPSIIAGNLGIYYLAKKIFKKTIPSIISAIVFNYNTYYLASTHLLLYAAGAWAIITLYLFIEALDKKNIIYALLAGVALFITTAFDLRATYIIVIVLTLYYFYLFILSSKSIVTFLLNTIRYAVIPVIIFLLLSIYWILPLINASSLGSNQVLSRPLFGNEFLNILYAITVYHPFWTGSRSAIFENQLIQLHFWLIPFFAFLGFILNRKNKLVIFFGFLALLGILLTKQVGAPFSELYKFLFENIPGFSAFREASKFYFLIILGYAILIGGFVNWLIDNFTQTRLRKGISYGVIAVIAMLFLWNIKPYVTGEIGSMYVARKVPADYQTLNTYLLNKQTYSRTMWVPIFTRWGVNTYTHPSLSMVDMIVGWDKYVLKEIDSKSMSSGRIILKLLEKDQANNLLDYASVQYLIVPPQEEQNEDFFLDYAVNRNDYIRELDKLNYLERISTGTNQFAVYENKEFAPLIYMTQNEIDTENKLEVINKENITYKQVSPSEFKISIKKVSEPFYLNFSQTYHSQWKLRMGDFSWIALITDKNYFLSEKIQIQNDMNFNTFKIDPAELCKNADGCVKDKDSYDIELTLYFKPQSYLLVGSIISIATLMSIAAYILISAFRKGKKDGKKK
jgi:hypothetical protein